MLKIIMYIEEIARFKSAREEELTHLFVNIS